MYVFLLLFYFWKPKSLVYARIRNPVHTDSPLRRVVPIGHVIIYMPIIIYKFAHYPIWNCGVCSVTLYLLSLSLFLFSLGRTYRGERQHSEGNSQTLTHVGDPAVQCTRVTFHFYPRAISGDDNVRFVPPGLHRRGSKVTTHEHAPMMMTVLGKQGVTGRSD